MLTAALLAMLLGAIAGDVRADHDGSEGIFFVVEDARDLPLLGDGADGCESTEGTCTLRAAIQAANLMDLGEGEHVTIYLPAVLDFLRLTNHGSGDDSGELGDLDVTTAIAVVGELIGGRAELVISGDSDGEPVDPDRIFDVHAGARLELSGVRLMDATLSEGPGGAIRNLGELVLQDVEIHGSSAVTVNGGGIYNAGSADLTNVTMTDNDAPRGGAIFNDEGGLLWLSNVTISGNRALTGGGLANFGQAIARHATFAFNESAFGEGATLDEGGATELWNSILVVDRSRGGTNCIGGGVDGDFNLFAIREEESWSADGSCGESVVGDVDPLMGPLADNGGPTSTIALLEGSPAIDGASSDQDFCLPTDQRGVSRPQREDCDIGAFELEEDTGLALVVTTAADEDDGACTVAHCSLREAIDVANASAGLDTIGFALPGEGPQTIALASALPSLTDAVVIDGTTQPGYDGVPLIALEGNDATEADGLVLSAGGSTVRGLAIHGFPGAGVAIEGDGSTVADSYVGTDATGTADLANTGAGISLRDALQTELRRNLIVWNVGGGIEVLNSFADSNNLILGNRIGVGLDGQALGNRGHGIFLIGDFAFVGDDGSLPFREAGGNTIAHNEGAGVFVEAGFANRIVGNSIHSNADLGIDLAPEGVNALLDPGESENTPNLHQQEPELLGFDDDVDLGLMVTGRLRAAAGTYRLHFYANSSCDESGYGEGERYLGARTLDGEPDEDGFLHFREDVGPIGAEEFMTATATDLFGNTSEFSNCLPVAVSPVEVDLSFGAESTEATSHVRFADVDASILFASDVAEDDPELLEASPMWNTPLRNTPLRNTPLRNTPLRNTGLVELALAGAFGNITLSQVPLSSVGGWQPILVGTKYEHAPLQTVTLRDVFELVPLPERLAPNATDPLTIGELDLSGTPARSLSLASLSLGALTIDHLPLRNTSLLGALESWCEALAGPPINCTDPSSLSGETVLSLSIQGAPLRNTPLWNTELGSIPQSTDIQNSPLRNTPLWNTPLRNTDITMSPLRNTPLRNTNIQNSPLRNTPLRNTPLANTALMQLPLRNTAEASPEIRAILIADIPNATAIIDCSLVSCTTTATLGDALVANAILATATLEDLGDALGDVTLGQLGFYGDVTLGDIFAFLPTDTILGDLIALLPPETPLGEILLLLFTLADLAWEDLPFGQLRPALFATEPDPVPLHADFTLPSASSNTVLALTLPPGFAYVPGSASLSALEGSPFSLDDPEVAGQQLTFDLELGSGPYRLTVDVRAGITLGPASASASLSLFGGVETTDTASIQVTEAFEPGSDEPGTAPAVDSGSYYVTHVSHGQDVDYFRFPVPSARTRVTFNLSHLPADYDLVVYGPERTLPRSSATEGPPLDGEPLGDDGADFDSLLGPLKPEALQDVPLLADRPVWGLSINRGTANEDVVVVSGGESGFYTIQVSSYNRGSSLEPYMLRVHEVEPPDLPDCEVRDAASFPHFGDGVPGTLPALPAGLNTVFLVNQKRLADTYGAAAAAQALEAIGSPARLAALAALGFPSAVVPVEGDAAVAAAYAAWDTEPCSPELANAVVRAITDRLDLIRSARPTLRHVVLVGADDIIPQARVDDSVTFANELEFAGRFGFVNHQYVGGAFASSKLLTDNPYGDLDPIPFFNRHLYVPELGVGRLVETPAEIAKALDTFVAFEGQLDPETTFTSGYDFLDDGAQAVHDHLAQLVPPGAATSLINDTWTSADIDDALFGGSSAPSIASINSHYDDHRSLPADQNATGTETDLFTTAHLRDAAPDSLLGRLLFSMGCHAGTSLSDIIIGTSEGPDWAQAHAEQGALFAGNTGFGYGDTEVVGYTEQLLELFAEELRTAASVGEAFNNAKARYASLQGVFGVYDEKVLTQMTLYGLPMFRVGEPEAKPPVVRPETAVEPITGLDASSFAVEPQFTRQTGTTGSWDTVAGGHVQVTHFRPLQPLLQLPAPEGARGALITHLASADEGGFDAAFSRPIVDLVANEPELPFSDVAFPTKIQTVTRGPDGESLVLIPGQFFTEEGGETAGVGTQRRFTEIEGLVYTSDSATFRKPQFSRIDGVRLGPESQLAFSVEVSAEGGPQVVRRVFVLYQDAAGWHGIDLARVSGALWAGGGPVTGEPVEFFVQAVTEDGLVGVSTRKGRYFQAPREAPLPAGLTVELDPPADATTGWHPADVDVTLAVADGSALEYSVDGGPFTAYSGPFQILGDGIHRLDIRSAGGLAATRFVPIDTQAPTVLLSVPAAGGKYTLGSIVPASYVCLDAGSGIESCTGTVANGAPIDTSSIGTKSFSVTARDFTGKETTVTRQYDVVFAFSGFFPPVANPPVVNVVKAGQGVPVKFSLQGDQGLAIFPSGYPLSRQIPCDAAAPSDPVETTTAGSSRLSYDATTDQYTYVWKTEPKWANTCRELVVRFVDGTERTAKFRFTR